MKFFYSKNGIRLYSTGPVAVTKGYYFCGGTIIFSKPKMRRYDFSKDTFLGFVKFIS